MINIFEYFPRQISKIFVFPSEKDFMEEESYKNAYKIGYSYQQCFEEFFKIFEEFYKMDLKTSYMSNFLNNSQFLYKTYDITYEKLFLDVYTINRFLINKKKNDIKSINKLLEDLNIYIKIKEGDNEIILFLSQPIDFIFDGDFDFEFSTESSVIPSSFFSFDGDFDFEFTGEPLPTESINFLATQLSFPLFDDETINQIYTLNFVITLLKKIIPATTYIRIV